MADCWRSGPRDARAATTWTFCPKGPRHLRLKHLGFSAFRIDVDVQYMQFSSLETFTVDSFSKSCIMVMQCTANSAGECHLDVVEVEGSNPPPCRQKSSFERGCFFCLSIP